MRNIATDAQDKDRDWIPKPDYTITWRQLYTNLAVTVAERGDTDVLHFSGTLRQGQDAAIHSWVPDWRAYPKIQYLVHGEWSAGSKRPFRVKMNRIPRKRQRRLLNLLPESPPTSRVLQYTMNVPTVMRDEIGYLGGLVSGWKKRKDIQHCCHDVIAVDEANLKQIEG
ncbi:MAG: hypothetical protein M1823_007625, partial [Watsoniomyces obsoletus]